MIKISLSDNQFALIDDKDFHKVRQYKWNLRKKDARHKTCYAQAYIKKIGNIALHRFILGLKKGDGKIVDHKDRNGLNCCRGNIRLVDSTINNMNKSLQRNNSSGYRGVVWHKGNKLWLARIWAYGACMELGYFKSKIDAAKAYNNKVKELYGKDAFLNKVDI